VCTKEEEEEEEDEDGVGWLEDKKKTREGRGGTNVVGCTFFFYFINFHFLPLLFDCVLRFQLFVRKCL